MIELLAGLFGLLIGSFLNVCIYRWPRDLSVVRPRSACPECGKPITAYDNIPVLSYLLLRGRCRNCAARIFWRYPLVEVLTAISFAFFVYTYGLTPAAAKYCVFAALLIGLAFSDFETLLLPDEMTIGGLVIGLVFSPFVPVPDAIFQNSAVEAVAGACVCSGLLWFTGWLFEKIRHKEGLGFGDVKMLAMEGAFLGVAGSIKTMVVASVLASVVGLIYIKLAHKDPATFQIPFGTFLAFAWLLVAVAIPRLAF